MILVDFHTHSSASKDSLTTPEALVRSARRRKLNHAMITDHNTISGARAAQLLDPELVIIGEEIMTTKGEILAFFLTSEIPSRLSPLDTIQLLRDQDAFISVSHPFDSWRKGAWKIDDLLEIAPLVDASEVFNARCMAPAANQQASLFAHEHNLLGTAGSDAHAAFELGAAGLLLPHFTNADELRIAIKESKVKGHLSPFWVHFFSRYAHRHKKVV